MQFISDEIERISGYPAADFIDNACRTFASTIEAEDREHVARTVREAVDRKEPFGIEYRLRRADGEVIWVLERGQLVREADGQRWLDGVIFDITERRRAELAKRRQQEARARLEEVEASRARIVEAADAERDRLERDLHDGAQQRLVSLALDLRLARERVRSDPDDAERLLSEAADGLAEALEELRELARGMRPVVLSDRGLDAAIEALARRVPLPVEIESELEGPVAGSVELAAYFVISEALTNVVKYAQASRAAVRVATAEESSGRHLVVEVSDDGVGGAELDQGSGLRGLADRISSLGGKLAIDSDPGAGTVVRARIPCE